MALLAARMDSSCAISSSYSFFSRAYLQTRRPQDKMLSHISMIELSHSRADRSGDIKHKRPNPKTAATASIDTTQERSDRESKRAAVEVWRALFAVAEERPQPPLEPLQHDLAQHHLVRWLGVKLRQLRQTLSPQQTISVWQFRHGFAQPEEKARVVTSSSSIRTESTWTFLPCPHDYCWDLWKTQPRARIARLPPWPWASCPCAPSGPPPAPSACRCSCGGSWSATLGSP